MKLEQLIHSTCPWLDDATEDSQTILGSWLTLGRNIHGSPFLSKMEFTEKKRLQNFISDKIHKSLLSYRFYQFTLDDLKPYELQFLYDRKLISQVNENLTKGSTLLITSSESKSILINGADHIKLQVSKGGLALNNMKPKIEHLEQELHTHFEFSFHKQFGYLTSSISGLGPGMKAEVLLHLPAMVFTGKIQFKLQELISKNVSLSHFFENQKLPIGNLFVLSSKASLGKKEQDIIDEIEEVALKLSLEEKSIRENIYNNNQNDFADKVHRAFGLLCHARQMSSQEAYTYLSIIKLSHDLKLFNEVGKNKWSQAFTLCLDSHLQMFENKELTIDQLNEKRAERLREILNH